MKKLSLIATFLSLIVFVSPAYAIMKLDGDEPSTGIQAKVQKAKEKAEQKYNETQEKLNSKMRKAFGGEGAALFNQVIAKRGASILKKAVKGQFDVGDFSLKGLSNSIVSQLGDYKLDLATLQTLAQDYEVALQQAKLEKTKAMNIQLTEFETEREAVNQAILADPNGPDVEALKAKLDDLDINIANLQGQIQQMLAEDQLNDEKVEEFKKAWAQLSEQINSISVQKASEDLLKTLNTKVASLFPLKSDEDIKDVYATNINRLFLGAYDYVGNEKTMQVNDARNKEYFESIKNLAREYLNTINDMDAAADRSKSCADSLGKADGENGQQTMQICVDLQNARVAAGQAELLVAQLRFMAIADMKDWRDKYKLRSYTDDPTVFNLDNYIFTKNDLKAFVNNKTKNLISNFKGF